MKTFKPIKCFSLLLIIVMILSFAGCSKEQPQTTPPENNDQNSETVNPYPEKSITIYVPWNAGSSTDMQIRLFQPFLEKYLPNDAKTVIVNQGGGSGTIGTTAFLNEKADGYSMLFTLPTPIVFKPLSGDLEYTYDDLTPVSAISVAPMLLAVNKDSEFNNAEELLAFIKENPGKFSYGHGGAGGIAHLAFEKLLFKEGLSAVNVPFSGGTAEAYTGVMGGHVNAYIPGLQDVAGREDIRVLINLGSKNDNDLIKDVPTLEELGYEGLVTDNFSGFYFMKGVDPEIITIWERAIEAALNDPEYIKLAEGMNSQFVNSVNFEKMIRNAIESSYDVMVQMGLAK